MTELPRNIILVGDAATRLRELPRASVDCVITSPPYYALRNYGHDDQLGLEATVDDWVTGLLPVFRELSPVIKPTGSVWLNLGDSFSRHAKYGAPPKSLLLAPERLILALSADGWIVRNKVIWAKTNPMPSSIQDRLTLTYEVVYFLARSPRYFFDLDAIREPHRSGGGKAAAKADYARPTYRGPLAASNEGLRRERPPGQPGHPLGKNPGDVWQLAAANFRGSHFATFPPGLVRRPLLATCPEAVCTACGQSWKRRYTVRQMWSAKDQEMRTVREPGDFIRCGCEAPTVPGIVADPFFGTGTVGAVACENRRDWLGVELNPEYVKLAEDRLRTACGPPEEVAACAA
ncbi:site-specific DNA-methyltransferase [Pseudofrankia sp. BMG5.37]|uniref:DNA-methyltransferase n=1 Tax=Pseudofrankia sp. BMG5.37 TaxID=3050035 RepID=UPI0028949B39|nr:site-specific DNA-methyltransferase [Pseudofrankia sp. BMG5.37]MDT3438282.1 site-specific DNA-methyltransferase [Pseudofrankia sp. BMG5.37]